MFPLSFRAVPGTSFRLPGSADLPVGAVALPSFETQKADLEGQVESLTGQARVLVRAGDLAGHGGIGLAMPVDGIEVVQLRFEDEEIVYANTGVCLHCPPEGGGAAASQVFRLLDGSAADVLMSCRFLEGRRSSRRQSPRREAAAV